MADGDFDLDAMLDSALDEEFDAPATAAEAGGESDGELDLDAMLDEAIISTALDAEVAPEQKQGVNVASEKTSAARQGLVSYDSYIRRVPRANFVGRDIVWLVVFSAFESRTSNDM